MVNISHPELAETKAQPLPPASLEALKQMREDLCSTSSSRDFKLQPNQRFLRRVLSPDSETRNLLMIHGTGVGKTCTAIQIAEEYIIRPEFQSKKVLVLANPSIRENFKTQIFDISRVTTDADGLLLSKQCTGRRYLEMIQRSQSEPLRYTDRAAQSRVMAMASKLIGEFYEFMGYDSFANMIDAKQGELTPAEFTKWIHDTFDNRLIIVDEAHNLKVTTETEVSKLASLKVQDLIKTANGVTLVLLTATPMFDTYDEVLFYMNLFLWNDRRIDLKTVIKPSDIFTETGDFKEGKEDEFRGWCQDYISFVKGENPFTFPFRLPPPDELVAPPNLKLDSAGKPIQQQRRYLTLTGSTVSPTQSAALKGMTVRAITDPRLICVYPENKSFRESFDRVENAFKYKGEKFLAPSKVAEYSSKFGLIMDIIGKTTGVVFVYSNIVEGGAQLFAMCLEEHGFESAMSSPLLKDTSNEITRGSKGKYVLFTSESSDSEIKRALVRLKRPENVDGSDIRVVIASPKVSEGVDFRYVRQVHILDPWFNMSRLEQVIGRGMRTCSHALLPFEQQNCTVYLHVCRLPEGEMETVDENIYRAYVEAKAERIAKVKRVIMESAMDCPLQLNINSLPQDWREELLIPQIRSQDNKELRLSIATMSAPTFEEAPPELQCKVVESKEEPDHERPLSAILDVKDEVLDKILKLIVKKPVWKKEDLYGHSSMKQYTPETISYLLQSAIDSGFQVKDSNGRVGSLESKGEMIAFAIGEHDTLFDKLVKDEKSSSIEIPEYVSKATTTEEEKPVENPAVDISAKRRGFEFPEYMKTMFDENVLNWYIVDTVLTSDEKINHFLSLNWEAPPIYAAPLTTETKSGKKLYILGASKVYNEAKEKINPIGEELDAYNAWLKKAMDSFVNKKTDLFASMKDRGIIFNIDEKSTEIKRASRAKTIGGRMCTTYKEEVLNAFSIWLNGEPFPEQVKTKKDRCMYLDLLVRKSVLTGKQGLMWITPEEFEIFSDDANRPGLLKRLKD
jgi:hypothetical protein